ncbi:MAG: succinate dehydrogenase cytochrome b subunit [Deltaproteobacteria bacterium]|nr:succinate dehydrogenase cytochrome b subunit [Deltaproteobacteria bacterium]
MTNNTTFLGTSIGKKVVMAASGFIIFGFVVVHIMGNLQLFLGAKVLNDYAAFLQGLGPVKWAARLALLLSVLVHLASAFLVTLQSWQARPQKYAVQKYQATSYAARTMWLGGPIIGLFVIYHLLHFTTGHLHPVQGGFIPDADGGMNVYNNVVLGFQDPLASGIYIFTMLLIGLHLYHGLWSMMQSVGLNHPRYNHLRKGFAVLFALFVAGAGISLPIAVLSGLVTPV